MESRYAIDMRGVKKSFDGAVALKQVDLQVEEGVCHGLIGENGAGKTTLMRILGGIIYKDEGTVCVHGKEVFIRNKHMSESLGIAFIPQELDFVGGFTVAENIYLGNEPRSFAGTVDRNRMNKDAKKLLEQLEIHLDPEKKAKELKRFSTANDGNRKDFI